MAALVGILILILLVAGLVKRKRSDKAWVKEERYEESGQWMDKRSGERGTWGSLDAEMAHERGQLVRQGRAGELAELIRDYIAAHAPGLAGLPDEQLQVFRQQTRQEATRLVAAMEKISKGQKPPDVPAMSNAEHAALKKQLLDFAYHHYPPLLDLDIDTIRQFDLLAGAWAETAGRQLEDRAK
ncbi:MAG: hypothetical protein ABIO24_05730 [Saprospiraceae bacterium]